MSDESQPESGKKKRRWPRTISVGSAIVKIYEIRQPSNSSGKAYMLAWKTAEGKKQLKFADPDAAIAEGLLKAGKLSTGETEAAGMTHSDRQELHAAREITGAMPLLSALREWQKAHELTQGHTLAAAGLWAQQNRTSVKRILASDAVEQFILAKEKAGKVGRTYKSKLSKIAASFPGVFLDAITAEQWSSYLEQWEDGVSRNDVRKRTVALSRWAQRSGFIPRGLQLEIEATERAGEQPSEIGIISPATYRKLLEHFRAHHPQHLAALVLAGFTAMRSDEIHGKHSDRTQRQTWEDLDLSARHLNVTCAKKNTGSWRLVTFGEAALEWLLLCPNRQGPVSEPAAMEKVRKLAIAAGFRLPSNCFRHSAISYKIALTGNKHETATWAGNSVAEIDRRYRRPVTKEAGEAWFSIRPGAVGQIVHLGQATA